MIKFTKLKNIISLVFIMNLKEKKKFYLFKEFLDKCLFANEQFLNSLTKKYEIPFLIKYLFY